MIINKTELKHLEQFVKKVLAKTSYKKENGLDKDITIIDCDHTRVYLETDDSKFTIRMWNVEDINGGKTGRVQWTLFVNVPNGDGSSHGEELSFGTSLVNYDKKEEPTEEEITPVLEGEMPF